MITLDAVNKKLQIVLNGAAATTELPIQVAFDEINSRFLETRKDFDGITTGNTAVDVMAAPSAGFKRRLTGLSVFNADTTSAVVTVQLVNGTTTRKLLSITLQTGEALYYSQHTGFYCVDVNGNQKSNSPASSGAASTADSKGVSSGTQASTADSKALSVSGLTSTADSKAVSVSLLTSTADSKGLSSGTQSSTNLSSFVAASGTTSSTESLRTSAGNSTTLSKTKSSFSF